MTEKILYTEEETETLVRTTAYRAQVSVVLSMLLETYQHGPAIIRTTLEAIARDYGLPVEPAPQPPGDDQHE